MQSDWFLHLIHKANICNNIMVQRGQTIMVLISDILSLEKSEFLITASHNLRNSEKFTSCSHIQKNLIETTVKLSSQIA